MNFFSAFQSGGFLMIPLAFIALINTSLTLHLGTTLILFLKDVNLLNREKIPSSRLVLSLMESSRLSSKRKFWNHFENELVMYERRIYWLNSLSGISTLSGLLGTVIGIFIAFQNMKQNGSASIEIFADGISLALITTIAGLMIAIPSMLSFYSLKHLLEIFEERAYIYLFKK